MPNGDVSHGSSSTKGLVYRDEGCIEHFFHRALSEVRYSSCSAKVSASSLLLRNLRRPARRRRSPHRRVTFHRPRRHASPTPAVLQVCTESNPKNVAVSLRSASTTSAPVSFSVSTLDGPVATATDCAPCAIAHATSSDVSPMTITARGSASRPPHARTRVMGTWNRWLRS